MQRIPMKNRPSFEVPLKPSHRHEGGLRLLFDRLEDDRPGVPTESPVKRFYDKKELLASIEREVSNILNTRTSVVNRLYDELEPDTINFGLPEMYGVGDFSKSDGDENASYFCHLCENAISQYEPRLLHPLVSLVEQDEEEGAQHTEGVTISIQADLIIGRYQEEITFPVFVGLKRT